MSGSRLPARYSVGSRLSSIHSSQGYLSKCQVFCMECVWCQVMFCPERIVSNKIFKWAISAATTTNVDGASNCTNHGLSRVKLFS